MKILILSDSFPPESKGGADRVAFNLVNGFSKKGHQVFVITTSRSRYTQMELASQDTQIHAEKNYLRKSAYAEGKNPRVSASTNQGIQIYRIYVPYYHERWRAYLSLYNPWAIKQVKKIIKEIKPDIVNAHNIHYYLSYHCLKIANKYSKAVFLTAHDVMLFHYGKLTEFIDFDNLSIPKNFNYKVTPFQQIKRFKKRYNPFRNIIIRHYLKYVKKIFAVSYALKNALEQNKIKNIKVIYNGINVNEWKVSENEIEKFKQKYNLFNKKIVFFGGRLSTLKGGKRILMAMKKVTKQVPESVLLVVGGKEKYAQKMLDLAKNKGISLMLTGWIEGKELKSAYHSSDLVVVPSIYLDPFPTINLEAMACKKPVIGSCFGGTPEIIQDGVTGYIVNPLDIQIMAEKIIELLKNPQKAKQFGKNGYQRVKKYFSLDQQVRETLKYYYQYL